MLAGIAEELGAPLGFRTVAEVRAQMEELGPWDGERAAMDAVSPRASSQAADGRPKGLALSTWKQLIDNGSMQDGDDNSARHGPPGRRPGQPAGLRRRRPDS